MSWVFYCVFHKLWEEEEEEEEEEAEKEEEDEEEEEEETILVPVMLKVVFINEKTNRNLEPSPGRTQH